MNLTTATTTTVLPCSSYLTEQSNYVLDPTSDSDLYPMEDLPEDWRLSFGHSPECRSYAAAYGAYSNGPYTLSGCGAQYTVTWANDDGSYPPQLPPGVVNYVDPSYNALCCGNCSLDVSEVRLCYFPDSSTPNCQYNQTSNSSSILSGRNPEKREHSLVKSGSVAIVSGYTLYVKRSDW